MLLSAVLFTEMVLQLGQVLLQGHILQTTWPILQPKGPQALEANSKMSYDNLSSTIQLHHADIGASETL